MVSIPLEGRGRIFGGLRAMFALERGILRTPFKEVPEGPIQVPQGLLRRNRGHFVQPCILRLLLEVGEQGRGLSIRDAFLLLIVGVRTQAQRPIVDETSTAKRASENTLLLLSWVKPVLIGSFLFNSLQYSIDSVKHQQHERRGMDGVLCTRHFLPPRKRRRVSMPQFL